MKKIIHAAIFVVTAYLFLSPKLMAQNVSPAIYETIVQSVPKNCPLPVASYTNIEGIDAKSSQGYAKSLGLPASLARAFAVANMRPSPITWPRPGKTVHFFQMPEHSDRSTLNELMDTFQNEDSCVSYLYSFSAVGLSRSGKEAIVAVNRYCAALCGGGRDILYLRLRKGVWKIVRWQQDSIS